MKKKILFNFIFFIEIELLAISVGLLSTVAGMAMVLAPVVAVGGIFAANCYMKEFFDYSDLERVAMQFMLGVMELLAALLIPVILYGILFFTFRKPPVIKNSVECCEEIAEEINHIGLSRYFCENIHEEGPVVFYLSPIYKEYSYDEGAEDMIKVKNYLTDYLKQHPENELNEKKIVLWFIWKRNLNHGDTRICNYNFGVSENGVEDEFADAKKFSYIEDLEIDHMSVLEGFENVRVISVFINHADSYDFLNKWNDLQYIEVRGSGRMTEEEKQRMQKIREFLPDGCKAEISVGAQYY